MFIERKNALFAVLSGNVIAVLQQDEPSESLRQNWLACRKAIDQLWNERLAGQVADSEAIYADFIEQANAVWLALCAKEPTLNAALINDFSPNATEPRSSGSGQHASVEPDEMVMPILVDFYQQWISGAEETYFHPSVTPKPEVMTALYGTNHEGFNAFYSALQSTALPAHDDAQRALLLTLNHVSQSTSAYQLFPPIKKTA